MATGRKVSRQNIEAAPEIFRSWGFETVLATNLFSNAHGYLAGTDEERIGDIQTMLNDPEIKAIACARGGYGTTRILDFIDFSVLRTNPKWLIGFSDITAIHLKLMRDGIQSIHGTMPLLFGNPASSLSVESLKACLSGVVDTISASESKYNQTGIATAPVMGGNLSLLADAIGTRSEPDTDGKILIIEEIEEYTYKVDRMLTQMKRAGKLDKLAGLVVGYMTDIQEPELSFGEPIESVILDKIKDPNLPLAFNLPIGHENPNYAWIHGGQMTLDVKAQGARLIPARQGMT